MDAESLQQCDRRRGRCLDVFLVASVIFLFMAVMALAAGGLVCVMELRSKVDSTHLHEQIEASPEKLSVLPGEMTYKRQNFAYLKAKPNKLMNYTIHLKDVKSGLGTSVGSNYLFDEDQSSLLPRKPGTYFIYIELNLTCTHICNAGVFTVSFGDKLTCEVNLPVLSNLTVVEKKCWTVAQMEGQRLNARMTIPQTGLNNWYLQDSGVGMFLVDS
ncbi:uncharacterized protein LOC121508051 [Cheilinus undulatus]|uniref:uncharacterized protein LOC121508051 n=1 Tax=Cheilinus undulatus TaxID=241271 RepID=UPI001BD4C0E6|nr:uncharacterized protein LOC121508051 [Cheilinus undulatus]